jgi:glucosamine--fructose-6-phosphate aminotransferase (isomerizing)
MCGIFAYTGKKEAGMLLLDGLTSLEYRGYDSAGVFMPERGGIRAVGAVGNLRKKIPADFTGQSGIAHLRWATHGEPTEDNAHPHRDCTSDVWVVHNGIIENYKELKRDLESRGHVFLSETDTEVMAHLVEQEMGEGKDFEAAARAALNRVRGTYGMAISLRGKIRM